MTTIHRAYKVELDPNNKQRGAFERGADCARYVYNWALARRKEEWEKRQAEEESPRSFHGPGAGQPLPASTTFFAQSRELTEMKKNGFAWMYELSKCVPEEALRDLDSAYQHFFRRVKAGDKPGFPRFKSRHRSPKRFKLRGRINVEAARVKLPRIGWVRLREKRYLPTNGAKVLSATVSERAGRWFVAICVEEENGHAGRKGNGVLGIDLGIRHLATCSDGTVFDNPRALDVFQSRLDGLLKKQSRQRLRCPECHGASLTPKNGGWFECHKCGNKFRLGEPSNRAWRTKARIAALHLRIANVRKDAIHDATTAIVAAQPSMIVLEDLNVRGMMSDHHIARSAADAAMSEFRRQIEYKAEWAGIEVVIADRWYPSSKTCSGCGHVKGELDRGAKTYICESCGLVIDRDLNAARNLASCPRQNMPGTDVEDAALAAPVKRQPGGESVGPGTVPLCGTESTRKEVATSVDC